MLVVLFATLTLTPTVGTSYKAEAASPSSEAAKVRKIIKKVIKAKNPKKTYKALSAKDKKLLKKELVSGRVKTRVFGGGPSPLTMPQGSSEGSCWSKTVENTFYGGITRSRMFAVTNTTRVCIENGVAREVSVVEAFQEAFSWGWHGSGVSKSVLNVGWEGRGVARGSFAWGAGGWDLLGKLLCSQMRLNQNFLNYAASQKCRLNG